MRSRSKLHIVALIYDFDGTLAAGNMQEYSFIESVGEKKEDFWGQTSVMAEAQDSDNVLVYMLLILEKAKEGPCIFVGRCADSVLSERKDLLNVFIYSDNETRIKRAMERYGISEKEAIKSIQQTDKYRASYYNMNSTGKKWGAKESYHIMLDSGMIGIEGVVDILEKIYREKTE